MQKRMYGFRYKTFEKSKGCTIKQTLNITTSKASFSDVGMFELEKSSDKEFAEKLEQNSNIVLFTKLKKGGFVIDTPYGNYSPDGAIICKQDDAFDNNLGIYFIVETKADKVQSDLTEVERNKIKCGALHFEAVSNLIKFDWVNSYDDFKTKFGVRDSLV